MDQLMAGSWTLLPLGWRVVQHINKIIREEMNKTGAQEMLMPLMHPKDIWNETGRWDSAKEVMYQFKDSRDKEFALSFTHEEIVMDLVRKYVKSYKDLPVKIYHFSTKFRNEPRAKSGILRGREFLMKDLYSVHETREDFEAYYEEVKKAYLAIFRRIGIKARCTEAAGGVFTPGHTHEFQVFADCGEDTVFYCNSCDYCVNKEIFTGAAGDPCPKCQKPLKATSSIEVGNIFPLEQTYAKKMGVTFTGKNGEQKTPWFGSYGIGPTRVMGTIVEISHDDKGIVWPESIAPYQVHVVDLRKSKSEGMVHKLGEAGIDILWDDREDISAGIKFADADLLGAPWRVVVSERTGEKVEIKRRSEESAKLVTIEELISTLKQ